ncbi:DUF697 domain-containing protein [Hyalangium minutum]|uniref:SCP2 domain-containing protein n=1 Tax=Hyalangium minutum TaxID=394096 RepID=A0A085WQL7_9BACT|nr:SCP2 sterol-binding domain-containing protein [Hyalangium minutum]KFE69980.1 hypothetical protein DB31_5022 [Hyalangium minutum]
MSWLDTLDDIRTRDFSKASVAQRDQAARDVINLCSYASAVVSISPIPLSDVVLMLPIQTGMVMTIGHIYGRKVDKASAKDLILELGATAGVGFLARQGIKALLPIIGALLTVVPAFAANWAMGRVAMEYFKNPNASQEDLEKVFRKAKDEGSSLFSRDAFDKFRKQNEEKIKAVADQGSEEPAEDEEESPKAAPRKSAKKAATKKSVEKKPLGKAAPAKKAAAKKVATKKAAANKAPSKAEAPLTVRTLIERELPRRIETKRELARSIGAVVHLDISGNHGGQWTVDLGAQKQWVKKGLNGTPRVTVRSKDDDFLQIATGQRDPKMAVLMGSLEFDPFDLELAGQVGQLLT